MRRGSGLSINHKQKDVIQIRDKIIRVLCNTRRESLRKDKSENLDLERVYQEEFHNCSNKERLLNELDRYAQESGFYEVLRNQNIIRLTARGLLRCNYMGIIQDDI
jgi:hypothetical protein